MTPFAFSRTLIIAAGLAIVGSGCGDALSFDLTASVDEFTVPGDPHLHHGGAPLDLQEVPPIEIQFAALSNGSVNLGQLRFFVTDTSLIPTSDTDSMDFLDRVEVRIRPVSPSSKLPELEIANWHGPAAKDTQEIQLTVVGDHDLSLYVAEGFTLNVITYGVVPYDDVSLQGEAIFRVNPL